MATYRRPDLLRRCLDALVSQTLAGRLYEVVVVDDGHTDDSREVVEEFAARTQGAPAFRYSRSAGTRGPAGARNLGWRRSVAPLIAFTDDDTIPDSDWLRAGMSAMKSANMAVSGRTVVPIEGDEFTDHAKMTQGLESAEFVTANAFVWRKGLEQIGGFDERFTRPWREDTDLQWNLVMAGVKIVRASRAIVVHPVRAAPWGISLGQQRNAFFEALLCKKHPIAYASNIVPRVPWLYYAIVCGSGVGFASGAWALYADLPNAAICAAVWAVFSLAGVASFAWRRLSGTSHSRRHVIEMLATSLAIPYLSVYWRLRGAWHFKILFL